MMKRIHNWARRQRLARTRQALRAPMQLEPESLETRAMLAGNVRATLTSGGDVRINGDSADNQIVVIPLFSGEIRISGQSGTTINGQNQVLLPTNEPAIADDLVIRMRGGNDRVEILTLDVHGDIQINMGSGHDTLGIVDVVAANDLSINTGSGDDLVSYVRGWVAGGHFRVVTGSGNDQVFYPQCTAAAGPVTFNMGSGDDTLFVAGQISDRLVASLGSGDDLVAFGDMGNLAVDEARVNLGGGDDTIACSSGSVLEEARFVGGGGEDSARFDANAFVVATDAGIEQVSHDDVVANAMVNFSFQAFQIEYLNRGGSPFVISC